MNTVKNPEVNPVAKAIITGLSFESLSARLSKIAQAEAITKHELGLLSREVLSFLVETSDVRIINTLLGRGEDGKFTLTAINRRVAGLFFQAFVPFTIDKDADTVTFAKKKNKVWDNNVQLIEAFLSDENNNIWSWAEENVKIEQKPVDYAGKITKDIKKALEDEENGLTGVEVMQAVLDGGISVTDLMSIVKSILDAEKQAA